MKYLKVGSVVLLFGNLMISDAEIRSGQTLQDQIVVSRQEIHFTFIAQAGQTVQARMTGTGGTDFAAFPELRGPDGRVIDSGLSFETAEIDATLVAGGAYTLVAKEFDDRTGSFTVSMVLLGAPLDPADRDLGTIRNGETLHGNVSLPGDLDLALFYARAGDTVQIRMTGTGPDDFDARPELRGPAGQLLDTGLSFATAEITARIADTGMHSLICKAFGARTGPYSLSLIRMPGYPQAGSDLDLGPLLRGQSYSGSISTPGDLDAGSFAAVAGDTVLLQMRRATASAFSSLLELYSPSGARIGSDFSFDTAEISLTLPESGVYTVIAKEFSTSIGPYTFAWTLTGGNTNADIDGDGSTNEEELRLGTDPFDASSVLRVNAALVGNQMVLRWPTEGGKRYRLQFTDNLETRIFQDLVRTENEERESDVPEGDSDFMTAIAEMPPSNTARFFRVNALP